MPVIHHACTCGSYMDDATAQTEQAALHRVRLSPTVYPGVLRVLGVYAVGDGGDVWSLALAFPHGASPCRAAHLHQAIRCAPGMRYVAAAISHRAKGLV
jgi:hypothetical protein